MPAGTRNQSNPVGSALAQPPVASRRSLDEPVAEPGRASAAPARSLEDARPGCAIGHRTVKTAGIIPLLFRA